MDKIENYIIKNYLNIHSPGYVIEVYKNNNIKEYVIGNKYTKPESVKTTSNTLYDIASLTKVFTSVLVYIAYENNLIDLNNTIYNINNNYINLKNTTILDLLCHNQEIYTNGYLGDANNKEEFYKILYSSYIKSNIPKYVDVHYIILSNLLETIYNKSYKELVETYIINKLNLKNTTFYPDKNKCASNNYEYINNTLITNLELGIIHDKKARNANKLGIYTGHAGIFSTGNDMLIFLKTFLDNTLLKKETIDLMLKHHNINKNNLDVLKKITNKNLEINELYKLAKKINPNIYLPSTYNYMGCRYKNDIKEKNDIPNILSDKSITFSGYTGPMFIIDFKNKIIVLVMCNILHNTKLDRITRKNKTTEIIDYILNH